MQVRRRRHIKDKEDNSPAIFKPRDSGHLFIPPKAKIRQASGEAEGEEKQAQSQNDTNKSGSGNKKVAGGKPKLAITGNSYTDSVTESRKNVKFQVSNVPSSESVKDYAVVNWLKGFGKLGDGNFYKVKMYGSLVDYNFSKYQVDSVDTDPIYWSTPSKRWDYNIDGTDGFHATDSPGPGRAVHKKSVFNVKFKTQLYKLSDLPLTTSGKLSGAASKAIRTKFWRFKVRVTKTGKFKH